MKKALLFALICISFGAAGAQFRHAIFLHHSVGNCFWDRSRVSNLTPPTTLPKEVAVYNSRRGYTGPDSVSMEEVYFPDPPEANDNNWYRWDNIFNGRDAYGITMDSYYSSYSVIVVKTCYLATQFMSVVDSIESYKTEWRHILTVMKNHPNNFFCIWTSYPSATDGHAQRDAWSNTFCTWAKDTLAAGKDSFGPLPANVYVFDVFHKLASPVDGYCDPIYGSFSEGPGGDHPSNLAVGLIDSAFVREMFDAAIAYEHPLSPVAATLPAGNLSTSGAQLNGTVNPNGVSTTYHFDYGLTSAYGTSSSTQSAGAATGTVAVSATVSGLNSGTTYHYRLAATYSGGTVYGNDASFATASVATPPTVTTSAASGITTTGAQVNGSVNPNGSPTTYHFDYGTTPGYGTSSAAGNAGSGSSATAVNAALTALASGTLYHYRLVAVNSGGTTNGSDLTFTTTAQTGPPTVRTTGANGVSATGGQLDGTLNPNGSLSTYHFDYGTTTAYGQSTSTQNGGNGVSDVAVNAVVGALTPGTQYHFRLVATNTVGTTNGNDDTLSTEPLTPPPPPASPTAYAATGVTSTTFSATWSSVAGATGYDLDVLTSGGTDSTLHVGDSITVSLLSDGVNARSGPSTTGSSVLKLEPAGTRGIIVAGPSSDVHGSSSFVFWQITYADGITGWSASTYLTKISGSFVAGYNNKDVGNVTSAAVSGLSTTTSYYYRVRAYNAGGASGNSNTISVTTLALRAPTVTTAGATNITSAGVQLNGSVNPNGFSTTCYFAYGLTSGYGVTTPVQNVGAGLATVSVSATVSGLSAGKLYYYRLVAQNTGGTTVGVDTTFATASPDPRQYVLLQNYPNPFNPTTTIIYALPHKTFVVLTVFNALGQPIVTLVSTEQDAGYHQAVFDGSNLSSGTYFYRLKTSDDMEVRRIVLVH